MTLGRGAPRPGVFLTPQVGAEAGDDTAGAEAGDDTDAGPAPERATRRSGDDTDHTDDTDDTDAVAEGLGL